MSASYAASGTGILFSEGGLDLRRRAATAALERRLGLRWTLQVAAGASIDGDIVSGGVRHRLRPGPIGVVGAGYRVLDGRGRMPFMVAGLSLAYTSTRTEALVAGTAPPGRLSAIDVRGSVVLGKVLLDHVAPYMAVRAFGGPVVWQIGGSNLLGGDQYHFTLGAGVLVTSGRVDGFIEVMPLGERSATFGLAVAL